LLDDVLRERGALGLEQHLDVTRRHAAAPCGVGNAKPLVVEPPHDIAFDGAQPCRPQAAAARRFAGVARRSNRERDEIVHVSREQLTQIGRYQPLLSQRRLDVIDKEAKRFRVRRYRTRQRILRIDGDGAEPPARDEQRQISCRARTDETADISARQQHCRAGVEPALAADLGREADTRQIDGEQKIVIAVGEQRPGASGNNGGSPRRNREEAVERVPRRCPL